MQLVERTALLAKLGTFLAEARDGSGSVVLLGGEAGVGKTSVARAFVAQHAASLRALWGSCEPLVTPEPLGPFHDMPPLAALIAGRPDRVELFSALLDELKRLPVSLMVIDDAQWADDATLDALRFLGRRVHSTPGMMLITFRDDEAPGGSPLRALLGDLATAPGCRRLQVPPLTVAAVTELAAGHAVEAGRLYEVTGGNPFYVTEVLAAEGWTLPATVTDAVLARVSRLDAAARAVLEVVSVAPGGLEPAIAVELSGGRTGDLDMCLERGVLVMGPERVAFRHELARLAVETSLPASRRQRLNERLVERLEGFDQIDAARLAHHADAAGDTTAVLRYAPLAAREASRRGAHRAAAEHLGRAVARAESTSSADLGDLVSAWADERMTFDDPSEVAALRRRAADLRRQAGDRLGEGRELTELGRMAERMGDLATAEQLSRDALEILERMSPGRELAMAYASAGYCAMVALRTDEALWRAAQAIELAASADHPAAAILALRVRATGQIRGGRTADAYLSFDRARDLAVKAGDHEAVVAVVMDKAMDHFFERRYGEATRHFEEAIALGGAIDLDYRTSFAEACVAQIQFQQGHWAEADRLTARLLLEHQRQPQTRGTALTIRGRIGVRRGLPGATAILDEQAAIAAGGEPDEAWDIAAGRAEAFWLAGRSSDIPPLVGDPYREAHAVGASWPAGELAFWLWRAGALPDPPRDVGEPFALHMAGEWRRAAAAWAELGCPYEQAEALAEGDEPATRHALEIFSRLGAEPAADRVRERMRRAGIAHVPARPRSSTRAAPAQLTRRQLEILGLLEGGLTNGEIAGRLFITEKTAGHHVSAILAKLGARSRTEAASTARKMGIARSQM
jgi:DNA-binding CsgD family transcriptional regulator/tetratricopeptide (TPR) repeat protein